MGWMSVGVGIKILLHGDVGNDEVLGLMTADVIHAINGTVVTSIEQLRSVLDGLKPRSAVVLKVERNGQFTFLAFELE